ncbi:oligosaccharide flippase family protein [Isobaculum melis]|uniref:Membrane protein involved in the export of O-antigen and teichoic acid n=1 Tax=Isobaculum melis TaxID=142588 RepID=A0A1H9QPC4_9LACT|nr:oligosaccharide flippase family protein [Isobaculum melis]SER62298.1 Membrane protein involved in the export of O-antigen and teichoic acid [Isobaculum melis]
MKIIKNYLYNVSYQLMAMLLPLVTTPYVVRVLGAAGSGQYEYSVSINQYFSLFALLGVLLYGNREIARSTKLKDRTERFTEIYIFQFLTALTSLIVYLLFVTFFVKENQMLFYILSLNIVANMVDISWFFMGLELFKKTVSRNMMTKIIGTICIFVFVKEKSDLGLYAFILAASMLLGQLVMWTQVAQELDWQNMKSIVAKTIKEKRFLRHISGLLVLFIPQLAIQIFTSVDKIILGQVSTNAEVGFYSNANKIARMLMTIATSLGLVMLPRMSKEIALGNTEKVDWYLAKSMSFMTFVSIPLMFGIAGISRTFVPIFFGQEFMKVVILLPIMSIIIFTISANNVMGTQYMIPMGKNREYTISVILAAIVSISANVFFVVFLNLESLGSAISSVLAEITLVTAFAFFIKDKMHLFLTKEVLKSFIAGFVMCAVVYMISLFATPSIKLLAFEIAVGALIYALLMILLKSKVLGEMLSLVGGMRKRKQKND